MRTAVPGRDIRRIEVVAVVGGGVALAGSWVVVAVGRGLPDWEVAIFDRVNGLPDALWPAIRGPMKIGSLLGSVVVVVGTFAATRKRRLTLAMLVASQTAWWSTKAIKSIVRRGRPSAWLPEVNLREKPTGVGYVSGHAAVAFALGAVLAPSLPRVWRAPTLAGAAFVAAARLYSGAHLPLDAIGGAGVGVLSGTFSRWAFGLGGEGLPVRERD